MSYCEEAPRQTQDTMKRLYLLAWLSKTQLSPGMNQRAWLVFWMDGWMNGSWKTSASPTPLEESPALSQQWISLLSLLGFVNLNLWLQHASLCGTAHNTLIENPEPCPSQKIEIAFGVPLWCSGVFNPVQFIVMDG